MRMNCTFAAGVLSGLLLHDRPHLLHVSGQSAATTIFAVGSFAAPMSILNVNNRRVCRNRRGVKIGNRAIGAHADELQPRTERTNGETRHMACRRLWG